MGRLLRITTLVDDTAGARRLLGEHGLAFWIDTGSQRILFDTGQGCVIMGNARELDIRLETADKIVVSHGHDDHVGGLPDILQLARQSRVYAHPAAFEPKYSRHDDGTIRHIGFPAHNGTKPCENARELNLANEPVAIGDGIFITGEIPRLTDFEDTGGSYFLDEACQRPDIILDDQALFFECTEGIVVLLGCAHSGVVNTLAHVTQLTDGKPIHAVIGGMHLLQASKERIERTVAALREIDVKRLGLAHCTGMDAAATFWSAFPERCFPCPVGTTMEFARN